MILKLHPDLVQASQRQRSKRVLKQVIWWLGVKEPLSLWSTWGIQLSYHQVISGLNIKEISMH